MQPEQHDTPTKVKQFGRMLPLGEGGTHVRPEPQSISFSDPLSFDSSCDGGPFPQVFDIRTPLVSEGRIDHALAVTDRQTILIKCYASGGENYLHTHTEEDHTFIVLAGTARFWSDRGPIATLSSNQAVLIPRGAYYAFQSAALEPLVLLRVGTPRQGGRIVNLEGIDRKSDARDTNFPEPVVIPGAFYPNTDTE
jgi:mannose-6-phosphate isomerase-like protein (cupin superfamily)